MLLASQLKVLSQPVQYITGRVNDANGAPVEFATVTLHRAVDSLVVKSEYTGQQGDFRIAAVPQGNYFVQVSMVGYERYTSAPVVVPASTAQESGIAGVVTLPVISLVSSVSTNLKEVTVQTRKQLFERESDRIIVNIEGSPLAAGATSLEVLARSPGITIDQNDNISMRGRQGVLVLLDGKLIPMTGTELGNMLRSMPAEQLEKIELITNPPAKYEAAGSAGIISIKTKKDTRLGTNGSVNLSYGRGQFGRFTSGVTLNNRQKKINLFGSYNYTNRSGFSILDLHRDFYINSSLVGSSKQYNYQEMPMQSHTFRGGIDYTITKSTLLGLTVSGLANDIDVNGTNDTRTFNAQGSPEAIYSSDNVRAFTSPNMAVNMNLKQTVGKGGELTSDLDYARYSSKRLQNLTTRFSLGGPASPLVLQGDQTGLLTIKSFKADYTKSLPKQTRLEAGAKLSWVHSDNDVLFTNIVEGRTLIDSGKTNHFIYDENIIAGYINLNRKFKKTTLQLGLRGEQTNTTGLQAIGEEGFDRHYFQFFPSASFKHSLTDKHELSMSMSRRIDRPSYNQLNPFRSYIDATTYGAGNPSLLPQLSYNMEAAYTFRQKYTASFSYNVTSKPMISVVQPAPDGDRLVVSTFRNLTRQDYYGITLTAPVEPAKWWRMYNNVVGYYNVFIGDLAGTSLNAGLPAFSLSSNSTFTLGKGWSADLNATYQSRELYGFLRVRPLGQLTGGFQKNMLGKKGTLRINFTDIFYTNRVRATSTYSNYVERFNQRQDSRVGTVSFIYRFGRETVPPSRRNQGGAEEEKRRAS
ncbi:TonB-dependent receptor [Telluribacter humicola]|uniref:TonB-dependent receptor n=1 Tax=Telluribacter humicola TaxID=1720261 RepID=UPI001A96B477|nr:TonB-dependent receptor [Telluribacter humicola]